MSFRVKSQTHEIVFNPPKQLMIAIVAIIFSAICSEALSGSLHSFEFVLQIYILRRSKLNLWKCNKMSLLCQEIQTDWIIWPVCGTAKRNHLSTKCVYDLQSCHVLQSLSTCAKLFILHWAARETCSFWWRFPTFTQSIGIPYSGPEPSTGGEGDRLSSQAMGKGQICLWKTRHHFVFTGKEATTWKPLDSNVEDLYYQSPCLEVYLFLIDFCLFFSSDIYCSSTSKHRFEAVTRKYT